MKLSWALRQLTEINGPGTYRLFPVGVSSVSLRFLLFQLCWHSGVWHLRFPYWNLLGFITCLAEFTGFPGSIKNFTGFWNFKQLRGNHWSDPLMARILFWLTALGYRGGLPEGLALSKELKPVSHCLVWFQPDFWNIHLHTAIINEAS